MKNLLNTLTLFAITISMSFAQNSSDLLKVNYVSNYASEFLVNTIKKQVKDEAQLTHVLYLMTESKVHYSLYIDGKNNSSFFALDSTKILPGVSVSGHFNGVIKDNLQTYGNELFMESEIDFSGNIGDLTWEFTDETKEIMGYECRKATLSNAPGYVAWFASKLPINDGPGIYKGLPGLVLEVNTPFEFITVSSMEPISNDDYPHNDLAAVNNAKNSASIEDILAKKDNFRRMIVAGK